MIDWIISWITHNQLFLINISIFSVILLLASIFMLPIVIINLPADYFKKKKRDARPHFLNPVVYVILLVLKNLVGIILVVLGLLMLVLPGQGIITLIIGLMIVDLPGEKKMLKYILYKTSAVKAMNWLRRKNNKPPFELPEMK
jgi:hypothetical protein